MRRTRRRLAAVLLTLVLGQVVVAAGPAQACACGAVITHGPTAKVADETSLIRYHESTEDIVMSLGLTGSPTSAAWFLPVPAKPTFAIADENLFNSLAEITAPRIEMEARGGNCGKGACAGAPQSRPSPDVSVVAQVPVGPYTVATLSASNGTALSDWLGTHGFALPATLAKGVAPYAAKHWLYVAVRLTPAKGQQSLGTQLPPLRVSFHSSSLVYPMRLTALATRTQTVRLYVLADHRMRADGSGPAESDVRYAGWVTPQSVASGPLASLVPRRMFLTRFDQVGLEPSQVTDDYHFRPSATDTPYQQVIVEHRATGYEPESDAGISGDQIAVGVLVLIVLALVAGTTLLGVRLHRRRG